MRTLSEALAEPGRIEGIAECGARALRRPARLAFGPVF